MSYPISQCMQMKAVIDEKTAEELLEIYKHNYVTKSSYTVIACKCKPPCYEKYNITDEMCKDFGENINKKLSDFIDRYDNLSIKSEKDCFCTDERGFFKLVTKVNKRVLSNLKEAWYDMNKQITKN